MSTYYVNIVCRHLTNGNLFTKMPTYNVNTIMTDTECQVEFYMFINSIFESLKVYRVIKVREVRIAKEVKRSDGW